MSFTEADQARYAATLAAVAKLIPGTTASDLISIKLRPMVNESEDQQVYIGGLEYDAIDILLSPYAETTTSYHGTPIRHSTSDGKVFVLIRHESGPEFIVALDVLREAGSALGTVGTGLAAVGVGLKVLGSGLKSVGAGGSAIIKLINEITDLLRGKIPAGGGRGRAGAVRVEKRSTKSAKVVRTVGAKSKNAIEKVSDLLD